MKKRHLIYFGTPQEAVFPLTSLVEAGHEVLCVITGQDKPRGRGQKLSPTPVKQAALELGLPVCHTPEDALSYASHTNIVGVVVAYGQLILSPVLGAFPIVNIHFSLLPRWRGAAPVECAILAGDKKTGVSLMELEETLDTGPVYAEAEIQITPEHTTQTLKSDLVDLGTKLLHNLLAEELPNPEPQVGEPSWAKKITPADLELGLDLSAQELMRKVRVGGAWIEIDKLQIDILKNKGKKLKVHDACIIKNEIIENQKEVYLKLKGGDSLQLLTVQPEGKKAMLASDWYRGQR